MADELKKYLVIFSEYRTEGHYGETWPTICYTDDIAEVADAFSASLDNIEETLRDLYPYECDALLEPADYYAEDDADDSADEEDEYDDDEYEVDLDSDEADIVRAFRDLRADLAPTAEYLRAADFDEGGFGIRVDVFAEGDMIVPELLRWIEWCEDEIDKEQIDDVRRNPRSDRAVSALVDAVNEYFTHRTG